MKHVAFKAKRTLHDSGYRHIEAKDDKEEVIGTSFDVLHIMIDNKYFVHIDCDSSGTYRIWVNGYEIEFEGNKEIASFGSDLMLTVTKKKKK